MHDEEGSTSGGSAGRLWRRFVDGPDAPPLTLAMLAKRFAAVLFAFGIVAASSAALGLFRVLAPVSLAALLVVAVVAGRRVVRRRLRFGLDRYESVALALAAVAALMAGAFAYEYALGETDQAFYRNDAFTMASTGGRARDQSVDWLVPGVERTSYNSSYPSTMVGYPALAAIFGYVGGYWAIPWVNAPLAFVASLMVFLIGRRLSEPLGGIAVQTLNGISLLTVYFTRSMMTENAATAVFLVAAYLSLELFKGGSVTDAAALGIALAFGAIARPEGAFVAVWFALLVLLVRRRDLRPAIGRVVRRLRADRRLGTVAVALVVVLAGVGLLLWGERPVAYLSANASLLGQLSAGRPLADAKEVPTTGPGPNWGDYALRFEWESAAAYGYPWLLLVAIVGVATGVVRRRNAGLFAALGAPYLLFVLMPPVTTFHPWFMRRLWVAIIPIVVTIAGSTLGALVARGARAYPRRLRRASGWVRTAAGIVLAVFVLVAADAAQGFYVSRESDGSRELASWLQQETPEGSCIIADQDVAGMALPLRYFDTSRTVVPFLLSQHNSFRQAFRIADEREACFLVRADTAELEVMGTYEEGTTGRANLTLVQHLAPREGYRRYLENPPLEQGYAPLASYLRRGVPPDGIHSVPRPVSLIRLESPIVLEKNAHFAPGEWVRTDAGLEAVGENATLLLPLERFSPDLVENRGLHLVIAVVDARDADVTFDPGNLTLYQRVGRHPEEPGLTTRAFFLPPPVNVTQIIVPNGIVMRGVMLME